VVGATVVVVVVVVMLLFSVIELTTQLATCVADVIFDTPTLLPK
jgi:hypothetical protein